MDLTGNTPDPVQSAEKIATPRHINGVLFDGTSDVTIPATDSTARIATSEKGAANGVAPLGSDSKIAAVYLPSYVDDVLEFANLAALPGTGEMGKIYTALDTGKIYRWSGSAYINIAASPGSTDVITEGSTNLYFTAARALSAAPAETTTTSGALINGATAKTTPVDADQLGLMDSAASNVLKKLSWANIRATLKTYFDTLYVGAVTGASDYSDTTWTPTLTFATPGDLSVAYLTRVGTQIKIGKMVVLNFDISTSAFTWTTASGAMSITGLPSSARTLTGYIAEGALRWQGITKAGFTNIVAEIGSGSGFIRALASGSGQAITAITAADMPSGGTPQFVGTIIYFLP